MSPNTTDNKSCSSSTGEGDSNIAIDVEGARADDNRELAEVVILDEVGFCTFDK